MRWMDWFRKRPAPRPFSGAAWPGRQTPRMVFHAVSDGETDAFGFVGWDHGEPWLNLTAHGAPGGDGVSQGMVVGGRLLDAGDIATLVDGLRRETWFQGVHLVSCHGGSDALLRRSFAQEVSEKLGDMPVLAYRGVVRSVNFSSLPPFPIDEIEGSVPVRRWLRAYMVNGPVIQSGRIAAPVRFHGPIAEHEVRDDLPVAGARDRAKLSNLYETLLHDGAVEAV